MVIRQLTVFEVQDAAHGTVQQATVVADDDDCVRILSQIVFQPQRAFKVEVVCRLIEQQHVGLRKQHPGQRHAHPPATGIGRAGLLLVIVIKAQTLEDARRAALGGPCVDIGKARLNVRDAGRVLGGL